MLRSMFSGISGLRAHQTMMDVTGNNIANVNTVGFKSQPDRLPGHAQPDGQARRRARSGGRGGTNPAQVGLGVQARRHHHQLHPGRHADHRPAAPT